MMPAKRICTAWNMCEVLAVKLDRAVCRCTRAMRSSPAGVFCSMRRTAGTVHEQTVEVLFMKTVVPTGSTVQLRSAVQPPSAFDIPIRRRVYNTV